MFRILVGTLALSAAFSFLPSTIQAAENDEATVEQAREPFLEAAEGKGSGLTPAAVLANNAGEGSVIAVKDQHPTLQLHEVHKEPASHTHGSLDEVSFIEKANAGGHVVNILPPFAFLGAVKHYYKALSGQYGDIEQGWSIAGAIVMAGAVLWTLGAWIYSMAGNVGAAVQDINR